jgi:hypothetical protein
LFKVTQVIRRLPIHYLPPTSDASPAVGMDLEDLPTPACPGHAVAKERYTLYGCDSAGKMVLKTLAL